MAAYDDIDENVTEKEQKTYSIQDSNRCFLAFRKACRMCDPENALYFALDLYYNGGYQREKIIEEIFIAVLEDKGMSNTILFPQVYQLLVPLMKRKEKEAEEELEYEHEIEEWKIISKTFNLSKDYTVSTQGRIKLKNTIIFDPDKPNKAQIKNGFNIVKISEKEYKVEEIVALTFVENTSGGDYIQHIDGNTLNDKAYNLTWTKQITKNKLKQKKEILSLLLTINPDDVINDPDRLSYIYRFAIAVWLVANSTSCRVNAIAHELFRDEILDFDDEDELEKFLEKNETPEYNRGEFMKGLLQKNLADCLFYSNILYYHPSKRDITISLSKNKKAFVYIWECLTEASKKAPSYMVKYLDSMRELALSPNWENKNKAYLLHIHFIHLWCLDPISAFVTNSKDVPKRIAVIEISRDEKVEIKGAFTPDFFQKLGTTSFRRGRKKRLAKLNLEVEPLLLPIDLKILIQEPKNRDIETLSYFDIKDEEETEFPNFNDIFQYVLEKDVPNEEEYLRDNDDSILSDIDIHVEYEDKLWKPLYVFYLFFAYFNDFIISEALIERYGDVDEYFESENYPNPFDVKANLTETEFSSFQPYIYDLLNFQGDIKLYSDITPMRKREMNTSTLSYRTIPSPIYLKSPTEITVIVTPRKKPTPAVTETAGPKRYATERKQKTPTIRKEEEEEEEEEKKSKKKTIKLKIIQPTSPRQLSASPKKK